MYTPILRFCKTAITWLQSLSAILPLFWRHDIAELHRLCREDLKNVLWRHEKSTFSRGILLTLYKIRSFHCILPRNVAFSLLTWLRSPIFLFFLLVHARKCLWVVFNRFEWSEFLLWWIIWFEKFHFVVICTQMSSQILSFFYIFNNLKILFIS